MDAEIQCLKGGSPEKHGQRAAQSTGQGIDVPNDKVLRHHEGGGVHADASD